MSACDSMSFGWQSQGLELQGQGQDQSQKMALSPRPNIPVISVFVC